MLYNQVSYNETLIENLEAALEIALAEGDYNKVANIEMDLEKAYRGEEVADAGFDREMDRFNRGQVNCR